ncbi:hypothetical protein BK126_24720 [Paenibacillus sp. FSL H7-0326]|uniref:DNA alkylation repair protein n=1 Tax=Paenibacillus sp. FSL H7-0326 TaxID=1921144 RepID=UPI00096D1AB4|nr:DNA alkylation repair protein [Paenibacillus sp. FSL H7-0326]OMC64338.1 hypothetical protein BK126_24720 [Paenibacillus sp. FSL H7-0326]
MAEPLKNIYNPAFLMEFGQTIQAADPSFPAEAFVDKVMNEHWEELALKARIRHITNVLGALLPERYEEAIDILLEVNRHCSGFPYLILPDYVEVFGQADEHFELSMRALETFTQHSSAEFAVRPFIIQHPERMMKQMRAWSTSENEHVRRLASEGCRPRLPWGQALTEFKRDPAPILPILTQLKADPSLYVRKSVANNLNDIAKDHPELVLQIAKEWMGQNPNTDWIVRHACRGLIKTAAPEVMALFGYSPTTGAEPIAEDAELIVTPNQIEIGDNTELKYNLLIRTGEAVRIRLEYGIDFVKSSGKVSRKKFLLSDKTVEGGSRLTGSRTHRWADLTTRRHYPGLHRIVLLLNGQEIAYTELQLQNAIEDQL